jgi:hypothetical protein
MPRPPRSNPKTRTYAIELRKEPTPAERKLWALIRNDQLGVNFRRQHAIGKYIPDFPDTDRQDGASASKRNSSSNWMGVNIWNSKNTIKREQNFWSRSATK